MHPTVKAARVAGAIYLVDILAGPFVLIYVPSVLVVSANPAATAANIVAHQTLLRLGIVGDLFAGVMSLVLALALYRLFEGVDRFAAGVMVILGGIMIAPIFFLNSLNWVAALVLARGNLFSQRSAYRNRRRSRCSSCACIARATS